MAEELLFSWRPLNHHLSSTIDGLALSRGCAPNFSGRLLFQQKASRALRHRLGPR